jgi:galactonate dehydratase
MSKMTFYRWGPVLATAVAAVDQALWDIAGRYRGAPVHELLGGPVRERARVYSWVGGDEPNGVAESAAATCEAGFDAMKLNAAGLLERLDLLMARACAG